jgi:tetratricopeptide (TPR) repeat protein
LKALYLHRYFKQTSNLEAFREALNNLKKARQLNPYFAAAYRLEFKLNEELLKRIRYVSMDEEVLAPLVKAEIYDPVNPFIKLTKARVYLEFNKFDRAKQEALKAITLEPEFVGALYFLQKNFNYFPNKKTFQSQIEKILNKAGQLNPAPGHYLHQLYEIPEKSNKEGALQ